jgi:dipeptidyl aminopeptidase/acylaminoacyl peptidase
MSMPDTPPPFTIEDALRTKVFADRSPVRFSPDGRFLAYVLEGWADEGTVDEVWVSDLATQAAHRLLPEAETAWGPSWSPSGDRLAFYADTGEGLQLWVWDAAADEARRVCSDVAAGAFFFEVPRWLPDGSRLVCRLANRLWLEHYHPSGRPIRRERSHGSKGTSGGTTVRTWSSPMPDRGGSMMVESGAMMAGTLAAIDIASGEIVRLAEDTKTRGWMVSPDGRHVAFTRFADRGPDGVTFGFDLCVVPVEGDEVRALDRVLAGYGIAFSWSPDSRWLASRSGDDVRVVAIEGGKPRSLTPFTPGHVEELYEAPLWSLDGSFLLASSRGTVWRLSLDGAEPVNLRPDPNGVHVFGAVAPDAGPALWSPDGGQSVVAPMWDARCRKSGFARLWLDGRADPEPELRHCDRPAYERFLIDASPARGKIVYVRESADRPSELWVTSAAFDEPRQVTEANPHLAGQQFGSLQFFTWQAPDGAARRSAFVAPPAHYGPPPYPTVFVMYEGRQSEYSDHFGLIDPHGLNLYPLVSHGYAVCLPDCIVSEEEPAASIRGQLAAAVDSAVASGLADPARLAVYGHSYGGYIVNLAVTGLDCFAAAICSTGMVDLLSAYGLASPEGESACGYWEEDQGRMKVPPWENPQRYLDNSPLVRLAHARTPLLILHGDNDNAVGQAWEMFVGLRRLGKTAELAIYEGEGHSPGEWRKANCIDYWDRILAWLARHLGTP